MVLPDDEVEWDQSEWGGDEQENNDDDDDDDKNETETEFQSWHRYDRFRKSIRRRTEPKFRLIPTKGVAILFYVSVCMCVCVYVCMWSKEGRKSTKLF